MMGYLFIVLATLCGTAKGYAGKKSSGALRTLSDKLYFGAWRTALCAAMGLVIWLLERDFSGIGKNAVTISVVSGFSMSVFLLSWIAAVRGGAYMRLDICCQTGMVIPCIFAAPVLGETVSPWKYAALAFLIVAIILLSDRGEKKTSKMSARDMLLLAAVWLSSGVNGLTVKLYANVGGSNTFYNLVTFSVSAIAFAVSYFLLRRKNISVSLPRTHYAFYLPVMAVCLYLNIFLQTVAAKYLDSMIMFPLQTVLGLFLSAVMAAVCFKEKPTVKNVFGIVIAGASLIVMNIM